MAVVKFGTTVKYNGEFHPAGSPVTIEDADFEDLVEAGAEVIEGPKPPETKVPEPKISEPVSVPTPTPAPAEKKPRRAATK